MNQLTVLRKLYKTMGHIGIRKLYLIAHNWYEWDYLAKDCATVVHTCLVCQAKKGELRTVTLQPRNKGHCPFEIWPIYNIINLSATDEGYFCLLLMVDIFLKRLALVPMRSKESSEVEEAIWLYIIAWFGCPHATHCGRGMEFAGALTKLCKGLNIMVKKLII